MIVFLFFFQKYPKHHPGRRVIANKICCRHTTNSYETEKSEFFLFQFHKKRLTVACINKKIQLCFSF